MSPDLCAGCIYLDDAFNHHGRYTQVDGHALSADGRRKAVDGDLGFIFRCQGNPVIQEVTVALEEGLDGGLAHMRRAVESNRAVVGPQRHHVVDVATVRERSVEISGQLVQFGHLRVIKYLDDVLQNYVLRR